MTRGDQLTVAHLLSYLHTRGHVVDLYTLNTGGHLSDNQSEWLLSVCRKLRIVEHGVWRIARGLLKAVLQGLPLQVGYFDNYRLKILVNDAVKGGEYDIVYNYYLRTAAAIPDLFEPNRVSGITGRPSAAFLALQLSQTLNTRRMVENEHNWLKRLLYRWEFTRLRRYEAAVWQRFTKSILIGMRDVDDIRSASRLIGFPEMNNWVLSAHGTDVEQFRPATKEEVVAGRIVFSGSMRYEPNVQAALWFVNNCWDKIRLRIPQAELYIVGQSPAAALVNLSARNGIHVTGTVPDIGAHIRRGAVCINPMRAAGGMQNKLIEYMACSKAIVATSIANEGIGAPPGSIAIADDAETFVAQTIALLEDPTRALALGQAAREYVVNEWTWERQFAKLEAIFYATLDGTI